MKKIFTAALCFVAAAAVLTGCTSKRYKPEETTKLPESPLMQVAGDVYEVPEEQKVFEVETDMYSASGGLKIVGYTGEAEELEIPAKLVHPALGECPVETIGEAAFLGNTTLKKVVIPEGVVEVKAGAFQSCSALTDVVLPEGLVAIGDSAFESTNLTNINIPSTVKTIGKLAFSTQLNPTPWYKAQTAEKVIVGDGILLKYNGKGDVTFGDEVKSVAYYAFQSPGAINVRFNSDLESFDSFAVYETASSEEQEDRKYPITFLVPYKSNAQKLISTLPVHCSVHSIPVFDNNPFKWDFNNAKEMTDSWTAGQLDMTFAGEGAMRGVITSNDPRINCTDILNLPAENFKTLKIRMKHDIVEAKTPANEGQFVFQIFYNNGTGLSEAASVKHSIDQSSNGEYIDYAIDMSGEMWTDIIKGFRIDITDRLTGEFLIDSIEFVADSEAFDYNTLLKPVTKYVPKVEDTTHKYKFEDEAKALAWTMAGFEYSYAPISVAEEGAEEAPANDSIHGILDAAAESSITSPVVNVPGVAYRNLIVRMRSAFDEKTEENKDNYKMTVYFDNGEGFSEERSMTVDVEPSSGEEKIEYTFDMYTLDGWYGTVKQIKIVLPQNMGGEFWIDKVEFVPEEKLTRKDFIKKLYTADGGFASSESESIFVDVVIYDDYYEAVIWATDNGLIDRVDDNMFRPDSLITDSEFVDIMNRFAALKGFDADTFGVGKADAPVYKMDAENAIYTIVPPQEEIQEPIGPVVENVNTTPVNNKPKSEVEEEADYTLPIVLGVVAVVVIAAAIIAVVFLRKKKK